MDLQQLRATSPLKDIYDDPNKLQLAHINRAEAALFDQLQGYVDIDPVTEYRRYLGLVPVFANPEVREVFEQFFSKSKSTKKNTKDKLGKLTNAAEDVSDLEYERAPGDYLPESQELISHSMPVDDELAFFPVAVLDYFDSLLGEPDKNKEDGLPQYMGFLKKLERGIRKAVTGVGRPIERAVRPALPALLGITAGVLTGGASLPITMAATGAGAGAGALMAGQSGKDALKHAAIGGLSMGAAGLLGNAGYGLGAQALARGATAAGLGTAMGQKNPLLNAALYGGAHYLLPSLGIGAGAGGLGAGVAAGGSGGISSGLMSTPTLPGATYSYVGGTAPTLGPTTLSASKIAGLSSLGPSALSASGGAPILGAVAKPGISAVAPGILGTGTKSSFGLPNLIGGVLGLPQKIMGGLLGQPQQQQAAGDEDDAENSWINQVYGNKSKNNKDSSILDEILRPNNLLPLAATAGMLYKGHQADKRQAAHVRNETDRLYRESRQNAADYVNRVGGIDTKWEGPINAPDLVPNPNPPSSSDMILGREHRWFIPREEAEAIRMKMGKKKGGRIVAEQSFLSLKPGVATLVHGAGKGQDDAIVTDYLHDGDYVIDASTVANLGDGSSDAGGRELNKLIARIDKMKKHIDVPVSTKQVPALLSDKEFVIPSQIVGKLGDGSVSRGSKMLKQLVKQVRLDKTKNGDKLPPKAKDILVYARKAGGKI